MGVGEGYYKGVGAYVGVRTPSGTADAAACRCRHQTHPPETLVVGGWAIVD